MKATGFTPTVAGQIIVRDLGCCARCGRHVAHLERGSGFGYALHHRRPKGMGGSSEPWINQAANGVLLCEEHHRYVHANPDESYETGFLVPRGVRRADEVPIRHKLLGLVLLNDEGGWTPVEDEPTPESMWKDVA